ncbi:MAG: hypothetical protein IJV22_09260 [Bacteroidales bacterium]|nr:hypothetical protein [Bacteroidales bacterium]
MPYEIDPYAVRHGTTRRSKPQHNTWLRCHYAVRQKGKIRWGKRPQPYGLRPQAARHEPTRRGQPQKSKSKW